MCNEQQSACMDAQFIDPTKSVGSMRQSFCCHFVGVIPGSRSKLRGISVEAFENSVLLGLAIFPLENLKSLLST